MSSLTRVASAPAGGRRISIKTKLLGSAGLLLLLMVLVGALGVVSMETVSTKSDSMYANAVQPLADLGAARAALDENRALMGAHILEPTIAGQHQVEAAMAANDKRIEARLGDAEKTLQSDSAKAAFATLTQGLKAYEA